MADGATNDEKGDNYRTNAIMLQNNQTGDVNGDANHAKNNGEETTKLTLDFEPSGAAQTAEPLLEKAKVPRKAPKSEAGAIYGKGLGQTTTDGPSDDDDESDDDWLLDDDDDDRRDNILARGVIALQKGIRHSYEWLNKITRGYLVLFVLLCGYIGYFVTAMCYEYGSEGSKRLLICTIVGVLAILSSTISRYISSTAWRLYGAKELNDKHEHWLEKARFFLRWFLYCALLGAMVYCFIDEGLDKPENLRSLPGLAVFILIPLLLSENPGRVNWHTVIWGIGLQFLSAVFVLRWETGRDAIIWVQDRFQEFFDNADDGSRFLFGESYRDHYLIFGAIPIMFFMNAALTVLYYLGVMQWLIKAVGKMLKFVLGTTPVESTCVATGIFLEGITTIMVLKPYLPSLTRSELYAVIVSVYSSLGGAYLAILSAMGVSLEFLIPAMLISAPATFAVAKLMVPETKKIQDLEKKNEEISIDEKGKYINAMDAAQTGAMTMLSVVGNIAVVLFAFYSFIAWVNHTLSWFGDRVGVDNLTIEYISSYLLYPVALAMGVEPEDCRNVAMLLGYRIGIYNVFAFFKLAEMKMNKMKFAQYMLATNYTGPITETRDDLVLDMWNVTLKDGFISDRSEAIVTYCLCGFSSFLNVAVVSGIMFSLVPKRKKWVASMAFGSLVAGNLANCMTACFASLFY
ncbi:solute carrier family 28 member 3 [Aplysia californica]|uniref:Solute carrier family 28 member 3 n=1 Tax=Aplysia californica TaxID=6500 RepID=A0ABM0ZXT5_APLCA|nr:solute carrier family 28 member 3 [Aplysia californica]